MSLFLSGLFTTQTHAQVQYRLTDLGTLINDDGKSIAFAINSNGIVCGVSDQTVTVNNLSEIRKRAFIWLPVDAHDLTAGMHDLGTLLPVGDEDGRSEARGISDQAQIVGWSSTDSGAIQAGYIWYPPDAASTSLAGDDGMPGTMVEIMTADNGATRAYAINNTMPASVTGWTTIACNSCGMNTCNCEFGCPCLTFGFVETVPPDPAMPAMVMCPSLDPVNFSLGEGSAGFDLNSPATGEPLVVAGMSVLCQFSDVVCGTVEGDVDEVATRWINTAPQELKHDQIGLQGKASTLTVQNRGSEAFGINSNGGTGGVNDRGQTVGWLEHDRNAGCPTRAVIWEADDEQGEDVGVEFTPPEGFPVNTTNTLAFAINNMANPQVVGTANGDNNQGGSFEAAVRWQQDEQGQWQAVDLNTLVSSKCLFRLIEAHDINDSGWIVGAGKDPLGRTHAFVLTPGELCMGDVDCDGDVDVDDLGEVFNQWGPCSPDVGAVCVADIDDDGDVDVDDLGIVFVNWGPCPFPSLGQEASERQAPEALENCIELYSNDVPALLDCLSDFIDKE